MLIFGTPDMSEKIESVNLQKIQQVQAIAEEKASKSCSEYFFIDTESLKYQTFDVCLIVVIIYSCFTSAYWAAFDTQTEGKGIVIDIIEWIVTIFFALDIAWNFMIPIKTDDGIIVRKHLPIAQKYVTRGSFIPDFLATFPF